MNKTLLFVLAVALVSPTALCTTSLLRLERAETPAGPWEEVPGNTLPITEEGAFQDTYESPTGYYRMRIDPGAEWGFPLNIPLEDVPPVGKQIAQELLDSLRGDGQQGWDDAVLGPVAFPMYTPGVDGPAYIEFAMLSPQPEPPDLPWGSQGKSSPTGESTGPGGGQQSSAATPLIIGDCGAELRGFILVSLLEDDFPVVEYSSEGCTRTECLRRSAKSSAVQIVRYDNSFMAAEDEKGQLLAYIGPPPVFYPDEILKYCDQEFEDYADPQGENVPDPPPFEGKPYESYDEFKKDWLQSERFKEARKRRKEAAKEDWEIIKGLHEDVINITVCNETTIFEDRAVLKLELGDPTLATFKILDVGVLIHGKKEGVTTLHVEFGGGPAPVVVDGLLVVSQSPISAELPTGWSSWEYWWADHGDCQTCYTQEPGGSCVSGCGATAWAMLYGYWDSCLCKGYNSLSCDLIDGCPTPTYNNTAVADCIWYVVPRIGTYCVGSQGATNPWNMYKGYRWATYRGCGISIDTKRTAPCLAWTWNGPRDRAIDEIKDHRRPSIVGFGCSGAHYALAYGYKYRRYRKWGVTWKRQRRVYCNMGWGCSKQWKNAEDLWFAARTIIW